MDQNGTTITSPRSTTTSWIERNERRKQIALGFVVLALAIGLLSLPIGAQRKPHEHPNSMTSILVTL